MANLLDSHAKTLRRNEILEALASLRLCVRYFSSCLDGCNYFDDILGLLLRIEKWDDSCDKLVMEGNTGKTELKIAVRVLVEHVLRAGDLELEFLRSSRPAEAIRAHQKIQKTRPPNYQAEFSLSHQFETDQFVLVIGGRVDGIFDDPDRVVVEEIKSAGFKLAEDNDLLRTNYFLRFVPAPVEN